MAVDESLDKPVLETSLPSLQVPELRTEPPSPTADSMEEPKILNHQDSSDTIKQQPSTSCALTTDTESEGDQRSIRSARDSHGNEPGRLSVFSRRAASKSSSENERRTMTIETEIVPNLCTTSTLKADHYARSLKAKASTDTVRATHKPKKKKSRVAVVNANHIPTKSEIYAATITQAVDEVEDSDSDETFVYESNPRSPKRLSRTPSMTSIQSGNDRHASFSRADGLSRYSQGLHGLEERDREKLQRTHAICGKRSMKFANNPYDEYNQRRHVSHTLTSQHRNLFGEELGGSIRSPKTRPGLDRRLTSPSASGPNSPRTTRPSSPRLPLRYGATSTKRERKGNPTSFRPWSLYEDEEEGGSSSERSPFLRRKSSRTYRAQKSQQSMGKLTTGMPFLIIIVCLMLIVCIVTAAALSTSQPLRDVRVVNITNVLVSKQELLFDVVVEAYNPNALAVYVKDVEISVFAQSPYLREERQLHRRLRSYTGAPSTSHDLIESDKSDSLTGLSDWLPWKPDHGGSHGPPEDEDSTTLLLGRVYTLDSTLIFESRFFNRSVSTASAELRVVKPGQITEKDGVEAWERVIQHSFELIIRGVIKYTTTGLTKNIRTAELYRSAHINPAKVDYDDSTISKQ